VVAIGEGTEGGFSPRDTFWNASSLLDGFEIETLSIRETPPNEAQEVEAKLVKLTPKEQNAIPEGFMAVGLSNAQYNALDAVAGSLSDKHTRNLILKRHVPTQPATHFTYNGIAYQRYSVELRGLHPQTLVSTDVAPASHIYVYSADGLLFLPGGFDTTALVPTGYQPDQEESRAKTRPEAETIVTGDSQMQLARDTFITTVGGITAANTSAKALLTTAINTAADAMLARARTYTPLHGPGDQRQDDRPLYWSRLQMMAALKGNGYVLAHTSDGAELVQLFEKRSRGLSTVDFTQQAASGKKKVLLAGFDPFDLGYDIWNSNPSGIVSLDLHGKPLTGPENGVVGFIQAVIFPMRYRDFNNGMVEEFFEQYLYTNAVDLIITMGMNDSRGSFDIDRFAARHRAPKKDNDDKAGLGTVGTGTGWNEFYESELSINDTMSGETVGDPSQVLFYDQSYRSREEDGDEHSMAHPADDPTKNLATPIPGLTLGNIIGNSEAGSAGNYLTNELFYRVARLRDRDPGPGSSVTTGHLSFPAPIYTNGAMTMKDVLDTARDIIARAIDGL
jgi:pyrrolidone-carboxylate peptidase